MFIIQTLIVLMYLHFSGLVTSAAFALIVQYGARSWCDAHSLCGSVFLMVLRYVGVSPMTLYDSSTAAEIITSHRRSKCTPSELRKKRVYDPDRL